MTNLIYKPSIRPRCFIFTFSFGISYRFCQISTTNQLIPLGKAAPKRWARAALAAASLVGTLGWFGKVGIPESTGRPHGNPHLWYRFIGVQKGHFPANFGWTENMFWNNLWFFLSSNLFVKLILSNASQFLKCAMLEMVFNPKQSWTEWCGVTPGFQNIPTKPNHLVTASFHEGISTHIQNNTERSENRTWNTSI